MSTRANFFENFLPRRKDRKIPDIPNLLDGILNNVREWLPPQAFTLIDEYEKKIDKTTHQIDCQLEADAKRGQELTCARGKRELAHQIGLQDNRYRNRADLLKNGSRSQRFKYPERGITSKKTNLGKMRLNQGIVDANYQEINYKLNPGRDELGNEFDPANPDSTLGNRAVLFDADGRVLRTANQIARDEAAKQESAKMATDKPPRSQASKRRPQTELRTIKDLLSKKKGVGEVNSLASLFAAVTGLLAIAALLALLVPMSFVTVALNWLQTVTTMFTNIRDVATTYLSMVDSGLTLFGYPKTTNKLKEAIDGIAHGIFGKENYESAKAAFAKGILNLTSLTKLLERVESARNGTDSKIDGLAMSLGTVNDSLKDAGMIPPDSEWSAYSQKVDDFVKQQAKVSTDPDLKENIEKLTSEIQTLEETNKEIKEEEEARQKVLKQRQAEADNLNSLLKEVKPIVDKKIAEAQE